MWPYIIGFLVLSAWAFWIGTKVGIRSAAMTGVTQFIGPLCVGLAELKKMHDGENPPTARAVQAKIDEILAGAGIQMKTMSKAEFERLRK